MNLHLCFSFVFFSSLSSLSFFTSHAQRTEIIPVCAPGNYAKLGYNDYFRENRYDCAKCIAGSVYPAFGATEDAPFQVNVINLGSNTYAAPSNWNSGNKRCLFCPVGSYANTDATTCVSCPVNSYHRPSLISLLSSTSSAVQVDVYIGGIVDPLVQLPDDLPLTTCTKCPAGFFQPNEKQALFVNNIQKYDWYTVPFPIARENDPFPVYNATGHIVQPRNITFTDIVTPPGACRPCAPGYYRLQSMLNSTCLSCPAGTYSRGPDDDSIQTFGESDEGVYGVVLVDAFRLTGSLGTESFHGALPVLGTNDVFGFVKIGGGDPLEDCVVCPEGTSSGANSSSSKHCSPCPAGSFASLQTNPTTTQQSRICVSCAPGSFASSVGSSYCTASPPGGFVANSGASDFSFCPQDTFSNVSGSVACTACPSGLSAWGEGNEFCLPPGFCRMGYYAADSTVNCSACLPGSYAASNGSKNCTLSPAGSYVATSGANRSTLCDIGTYSDSINSTACTPCAPGSYAASTGTIVCTSSPAGSYVATSGANRSTLCDIGTYSDSINSTACTPCSPGSYAASTGTIVCTPSPAGSFVATSGANRSTLCDVGTYSGLNAISCTLCEAGSYISVTGASFCNQCVSGTFSSILGSNSSTDCIFVPPGTYSNSGANSSTPCEPGFFAATAGSSVCTRSPRGSYVPFSGSNSSTLCDVGTFSNRSALSSCFLCPAGSYVDITGATSCIKCKPGSYSATSGGTSIASCLPCAPGSSQKSYGAASCELCSAGRYSVGSGAVNCKPCPYGTASSAVGMTAATCTPCTAGNYAFPGFAACLPCWAGSYNNEAQSGTCIPCPEGTVSTTVGATSSSTCVACPTNTYSYGSGACSTCPPSISTFSSSTLGCKPIVSGTSPIPDFFLSGTQAEGLSGMQIINNPSNISFVPDSKGNAGGAIKFSDGSFLSTSPALNSALASMLPSATTSDMTISAFIKCDPFSPPMVAVQWGGNASSNNNRLAITVGTIPGMGWSAKATIDTNINLPSSLTTITKDGKTLYRLYGPNISPSVTSTNIATGVVTVLVSTTHRRLSRPMLNPAETKLYYSEAGITAGTYKIKVLDLVTLNNTDEKSTISADVPWVITSDNHLVIPLTSPQKILQSSPLDGGVGAAVTIKPFTNRIYELCFSPNASIFYVQDKDAVANTYVITAYNIDGSILQSFRPFSYAAGVVTYAQGFFVTDNGKYLYFSIFDENEETCSFVLLDAFSGALMEVVGDDSLVVGDATLSLKWPVTNPATSSRVVSQIQGNLSFYMQVYGTTPSPPYTHTLVRLDLLEPYIVSCDGTWHHIAQVYSVSSGTTSFIVDGAVAHVDPISAVRRRRRQRQLISNLIDLPPAGSSTLAIGWNGDLSVDDGAVFTGSISDVRVYSSAVSTSSLLFFSEITIPTFANAINPSGGFIAGVSSYNWTCLPGFYGQRVTLTKNASIADGAWAFSTPNGTTWPLSNPPTSICTPCAAGSYAETSNMEVCTLCGPMEFSSDTTGATSCIGRCSVGSYSSQIGAVDSSVCIVCPLGAYRNTAGQDVCYTSSPSGGGGLNTTNSSSFTNSSSSNSNSLSNSTSNSTSLTNSTNSSSSSSSISCPGGSISQTNANAGGSPTCTNCSAGTFSNSFTANKCLPCGKGTFSTQSGSSRCTPCDAGKFSSTTGSVSCDICPAGTWSNFAAAVCSPCEYGTFSSTPGSQTCSLCSRGYFSRVPAGAVSCSPSPPGFFIADTGQSLPTACPIGSFSTASAGIVCSSCIAGSYTNDVGSQSCLSVGPGFFTSVDGESVPTPCPAGSFSAMNGSSSCSLCSPGSFAPFEGTVECTLSAPGNFTSTSGLVVDSYCPAGSYAGTSGLSSCTPCAPGSFAPFEGTVECTLSAPGNFTSTSGLVVDSYCPAGSYAGTSGLSSCTPCAPGSFASTQGSSLCALSAPGNYTASSGETQDSICAPGSYSTGGASQCTPCPTGDEYAPTVLSGSTFCNCSTGYAWDSFNEVCNVQPTGQTVTLSYSFGIPALCSDGNAIQIAPSLILDPASGIATALRTAVASAAGYDPSAAVITAVSICNTTFFVVLTNATINVEILANAPPPSEIATALLAFSPKSSSQRRRQLQQRRQLISSANALNFGSTFDEISISVGLIMPQVLVAPLANFIQASTVDTNNNNNAYTPSQISSFAASISSIIENAPPGSIPQSGDIVLGGAPPSTLSTYFLAALRSVANATVNASFALASSLRTAATPAIAPILASSGLPPNTSVTLVLKSAYVGGFVYIPPAISISAKNPESSSTSQSTAIITSVVVVIGLVMIGCCLLFCVRRRRRERKDEDMVKENKLDIRSDLQPHHDHHHHSPSKSMNSSSSNNIIKDIELDTTVDPKFSAANPMKLKIRSQQKISVKVRES